VVRTVRVRLELDRNDFKQGLRDAANDMRTFDAEVKTLGKDTERTSVNLKDTSTTARKLGDDVKKSSRDVDALGTSAKKLGDEVEKTGNKVRKSVSAVGSDVEKLGKTGLKAGELFEGIFTDFSGTLAGAAKSLASAPELVAIGGAIAVPIGAGLGAALSGAVLAGTAGAGLAAGILLAGRSSEVHDAWTIVANDALNGFSNAASSFQEPLVRAAKTFDDALASDMPRIRRDFEILAPLVDDLAKGTAGLFHNVIGGPGLQDAFRGAIPVIKELSADLPKLGDDVDRFFSELGGTGRAGAQALGIAVDVTGASLRGLGTVLAETSTLFELTGTGAVGLLHDLGVLGDTADILTASPLASLSQILGGNKDSSDDFSKSLEQLKNDMADAGSQKAFDRVMTAARNVGLGVQLAAADFQNFSAKISGARQDTDALAASMVDKLLGSMMSIDQANLGVASSLTQVTEGVKTNGHELDIHTAKGQANTQAILGAVQANIGQYDALIRSGAGAEQAAAAYDANTGALEHQMHQAGFTQAQIDGLIGKYRGVPANVDTDIATYGLTEAINGLNDVIRLANHLDGRVSTVTIQEIHRTTYTSDTAPSGFFKGLAKGGVVSYASGGVHDYKMSLRPDYTARSGLLKPSNPGTILAGEPSTGGEVFGPRLGVSHERGLQLAGVLAGWHGGRVVAGPMGGTGVAVQVHSDVDITVRDDTGRMFKVVRKEVRTKHGGDVQRAFGS
jgi:hypothetical protein